MTNEEIFIRSARDELMINFGVGRPLATAAAKKLLEQQGERNVPIEVPDSGALAALYHMKSHEEPLVDPDLYVNVADDDATLF